MIRIVLRSVLFLGWLVPVVALPALAAAPPGAVVTAAPASSPIVLDGSLDEPAWTGAGTISGLTQQDPEPGQATPFDATRISVLSTGDTLYFGVVCPDPEPEKIAVHTLQRDADLEGDDTVAFVLDTFGDGRTGYLFRINAGGARQDGLISGPEEVSLDWDGIWEARTRRMAGGWSAEIAISARGLRFRPGLPGWGMNTERFVARERITLRWLGSPWIPRWRTSGVPAPSGGLPASAKGWGSRWPPTRSAATTTAGRSRTPNARARPGSTSRTT